MKNKQENYKQAILVGAAPIGEEKKQLLSLLKWAGKDNSVNNQEASCGHPCNECKSACSKRKIEKDIYVIAVDGGINFFAENEMLPDFLVGDLDSAGDFLHEANQIPHLQLPVEKDDTDMAIAASKAYELGYREILIYGGYGGPRISHTLANIQLMRHYKNMGCNIRVMGDGIRMEILQQGMKELSGAMKGSLSIICLSDKADFVRIKGLKYEYEGPLTATVSLGVSNSFVGKDAFVEVTGGVLLLIYEK